MAEAVGRKKKKRGVLHASVTKLLRRIDETLAAEQPPDKGIVEEYWNMLVEKENLLEELDREIEAGIDEDDLEEETESVMKYQEDMGRQKTRMRRLLNNLNSDDAASEGTERSSHRSAYGHGVKLPKLVIDHFKGDISLWQTFWSQFEMVIHNNPELSKADKFNYLKSYLSGAAANVNAGLALTEANYDSAIKMLTNRFGRKDLVINAHMQNLLSLTPVKKSYDTTALRKPYDECEIQIRSLSAMGVVSNTYGPLLCPILMQMIPEDLALSFSRIRDEDEILDVNQLMKFLKKEVESRERTANLTRTDSVQEEREKNERQSWKTYEYKNKKLSSAAALHTVSYVEHPSCIFCENSDVSSKQLKKRKKNSSGKEDVSSV